MLTGGNDVAKNLEISLLLDFYGDMLTSKQHEVIEYYYNDDLSLAEIADNQGITRQGVRDSIKRAELQLLEMEQRLGLARRFREMRSGLEQIRKAASQIQDYNNQFIYAHEIEENAQTIMEIAQKLSE
jgi:predicted DNA-binding protein YlxM (UPF0122 family)